MFEKRKSRTERRMTNLLTGHEDFIISHSLEIEAPLKEFKAKLKEQIRLNNR